MKTGLHLHGSGSSQGAANPAHGEEEQNSAHIVILFNNFGDISEGDVQPLYRQCNLFYFCNGLNNFGACL
jgi:hypothetical protein